MSFNFQPASVASVVDTLMQKVRPLMQCQTLPLLEAEGRVLAEALIAPFNIPPHDNSAMDGYALRHAEAGAPLPVSQVIAAGTIPKALEQGTVARIFTGAPIPDGADTVIPQEQVQVLSDGRITCLTLPAMGQYIRLAGEDIGTQQLLLEVGQILTPNAIGLAASTGQAELLVFQPLKVAIFFTGDELLEPGCPPAPNKIYNTNRYWLHTRLKQLHCVVSDWGIVQDDQAAIEQALLKASEQVDVILTCGGVSVGEKDFVKAAVNALGELYLWKVAMKPGKPFAFGRIQQVDFMGLPGNPVSALVAFELFVKPFLLARLGVKASFWQHIISTQARFSVVRADPYREEFLRVKCHQDATGWSIEKYPNQSSGVFSSCFWADGLARIPVGKTIEPGDWVDFLPW